MSLIISLHDPDGANRAGYSDDRQIRAVVTWERYGKLYDIATLTVTHNERYPTPVITVEGPHPGIRLNVYDHKGGLAFTNYQPRQTGKVDQEGVDGVYTD